jgi:integrase
MPIKLVKRGKIWHARGRIEYNGRPITNYIRESTGTSSETGARQWISEREDREIRRHLYGEKQVVTFSDAVLRYNPKPRDARYLIMIVREIGHLPIVDIKPKMLKALGPKLLPDACTDTWWRAFVATARAVINSAHENGLGTPPIRIQAYTTRERLEQDEKRGKRSRIPRRPFTREWVERFCAYADLYNAALVRFMFETAARISQAIAVEPDHVDLKACKVWLCAQKGHEAQWVSISKEMAQELAQLPPKRPVNKRTGKRLQARVFGYASRGGPRKAWAKICAEAGIPLLTPHCARHGFYTELRVNQRLDPITVAEAGRWKSPTTPDKVYAHARKNHADIRARFRTPPEQGED